MLIGMSRSLALNRRFGAARQSGRAATRRSRYRATLVPLVLGLLCGCSNRNAYLEVVSGEPIRSKHGIRVYAVHVGSTETLRLTVWSGNLEYAIAHDLQADQYVDCGTPLDDQFEWLHHFNRVTPDDAPMRIKARAYIQMRTRDLMPIGGRVERRKSKFDDDDVEWAVGTIAIHVYQAVAEFEVNLGDRTPNWSLSRVVFWGADGNKTEHRQAPGDAGGFTVDGPAADGTWRVRCEPSDIELRREGTTLAELIVADDEGRTRRFETQVGKP